MAKTKIKLRAGDTLVIDTVAGNVQLNFLRRFLNEGFQSHLQNNELLHQVRSILYAAHDKFVIAALPNIYGPTSECCCVLVVIFALLICPRIQVHDPEPALKGEDIVCWASPSMSVPVACTG